MHAVPRSMRIQIQCTLSTTDSCIHSTSGAATVGRYSGVALRHTTRTAIRRCIHYAIGTVYVPSWYATSTPLGAGGIP